MIDFRINAKEIPGIFQPDFKINYEEVDIIFEKGEFRIKVGCQRCTINKDNVEQMLSELNGGTKGVETVKIILPKGSTRTIKSIKSVPIFMDESPDYLISKNKKIYPKDINEVVEKDFELDNDYFTVNKGTVRYNNYQIQNDSVKRVQHILSVIQDYYASEL